MTNFTALRAGALSLALALPAFAQGNGGTGAANMDPVDTAPIAEAIETFEDAFDDGDMEGIFDAMPPAVLSHLAERFGVEESEVRRQMAAATTAAMAQVELEDFGMDLAAAETGRTPEGRAYALVPTTSTMAVVGSGRFRSVNTTLALEEDGAWYLIRVDDPGQVALVREVYPDIAEVAFAEGTMEPLE